MADPQDPRKFLDSWTPEDMRKFFLAPLDRDYFEEWMRWLAALYSFEPDAARLTATFEALTGARFTNAEIGLAADWIAGHSLRFPVLAEFIGCPALGRNFSKS